MAVLYPNAIPKPIKRILVCGGRDVTDTAWVYRILDDLHKSFGFSAVIEGDARGADRIGGYWARSRGLDNIKFPADWVKHGKAAGAIRNQQMLDEGKPDLVIAFGGGRGTADMLNRAKKAGLYWQQVRRAIGDIPLITSTAQS